MAKTKITIRKHVTTQTEIEVDLPYYYKHDLSDDHGDSIIYGRIDGEISTAIHENESVYGDVKYEIEKEKWTGDGSYFSDDHKSTELEYNKVKERLKKFFNCL